MFCWFWYKRFHFTAARSKTACFLTPDLLETDLKTVGSGSRGGCAHPVVLSSLRLTVRVFGRLPGRLNRVGFTAPALEAV